ncbi:S24 family peptidase [Sodalis ligni]|uniref:DNA polymerase V n=1 Tax=Sodalis ligni TaxID=2697027 RepID=A0A4R1NAM6_9GAMM|nr:S24 family peptidase [Sodalis ligni]TCL03719.1 DNA polymerase V [Sodalis ligni]
MAFPSPAQDYLENRASLDAACIRHPASTFLMRVSQGAHRVGIFPDALLVVDRSLAPVDGSIIVAEIGSELALRRVRLYPVRGLEKLDGSNDITLYAEGEEVMGEETICWGVVTHAVNDMRTGECDDNPCLF